MVGWKIYPAYVEFYILEPPNDTVKTLTENSRAQNRTVTLSL